MQTFRVPNHDNELENRCTISFRACGRCLTISKDPVYDFCDILVAILGECNIAYKGLQSIPPSECTSCIANEDTLDRRLRLIRTSIQYWRDLEKEVGNPPEPSPDYTPKDSEDWREQAERDVVWRFLETSVGVEVSGGVKVVNRFGLPVQIEAREWMWFKKYYDKVNKARGINNKLCGACKALALGALHNDAGTGHSNGNGLGDGVTRASGTGNAAGNTAGS